jgi:peptidyl-prolyl cis-trans isomerase D
VLPQERVGDKYIVAAVTQIFKEGTMTADVARLSVEPILKNKKKAEQIKQKIGKLTTLEAAATIIQNGVTTIDSLRFNGGQLGFEPKITGAAFNPANKGKLVPEPLEGVSGVYVMRVDDLSSTPVIAGSIADQQKEMRGRTKQMGAYYNQPVQALRKSAKIKDNRRSFF